MSRLDLRIFLSSPGDVADERALARTVLDRLSQEYALRDRIHIEEVSSDDPGAPVPMDAHLTPQQAIDNRRPKPSQCDVVVVILWSRMGTPLPPEHRKPDGTPYASGTEYEFCDAMDAAKRTGKPTVLVYRRTEEPRIGLRDRDLDEKHRQYQAVETFFAQFTNTDGSLRQSYTPYGSPSAFADKLERELRELIQVQLDALPKDAPALTKNDASAAAIAIAPVFDDSRRFAKMATLEEKKLLIHPAEQAIRGRGKAYPLERVKQCEGSQWEFDRIVYYLAQERWKRMDRKALVRCVNAEFEKVMSRMEPGSLVPLYYALRALRELLDGGDPKLMRDAKHIDRVITLIDKYVKNELIQETTEEIHRAMERRGAGGAPAS